MDPGLLPLTQRILHQYGLLRLFNLAAAGVAAVCMMAVGSTSTWPSPVLLVLLTGLLVSKIWQFMRNDRALKQIRLEERFLRQPLDPDLLRRCLSRSEHVWDDSCTLRGLRAVLVKPLPRLMPQREKIEFVRRKYHRVHQRLLPTRAQLGVIVPLFVLAHIVSDSTLAARPSIAVVVVLALAALEVAQLRTTWLLHGRFRQYENALSRWTLSRPEFQNILAPPVKSYRHDLLYRAAPLFSAGLDASAAPTPG